MVAKKLRVFFVVMCMTVSAAFAQDIHFSQYYASPLLLNPAMTGGFNGAFRVAGIYRNQWFTVTQPYVTYGGSFDMPLFRKALEYDQAGVGISAFSDKSGDGGLTNQAVMLSGAFHKVLDSYNRHSLSLGFQGGLVQKRIDFSKLKFEEQYNPEVGFDPSILNGESFNDNIMYPDMGMGLLWRSRFSTAINSYVGFAAYHLTRPEESFLAGNPENNRLNPRFVLHGGSDFKIGRYTTLIPGFLYMSQNTASELTVGAALGYNLKDDVNVYFGSWFRAFDKDALIVMAAYEYKGLRVGASYDVNISDLRAASNTVGAVELSLIYIHNSEPPRQYSPVKFCPRF